MLAGELRSAPIAIGKHFDGVFFVGGGRDRETNLTALVQRAAQPSTDAKGTLPASHAELQRHLPAGLSGVAHGDFDALLSLPAEWLSLLLGELTPFGRTNDAADPEQAAALRAMPKEHRLSTARSATGASAAAGRCGAAAASGPVRAGTEVCRASRPEMAGPRRRRVRLVW